MKIVSEEEEFGYDIIARVTSQCGHCAAGHIVGDEVVFHGNEVRGKICFHVLTSILPRVMALRYGAQIPWLDDPDKWHQACPDPINPVAFQLIPRTEKGVSLCSFQLTTSGDTPVLHPN